VHRIVTCVLQEAGTCVCVVKELDPVHSNNRSGA
jgi:hypothetical protein